MSKQPFDDFTGGVVTPRGTVYFEDGVLIIPKQKNKKTPAVSGNHDKELKMKKLLLVSKGGKPTGRLKIFANTTISGTPEEIEELKSLAKSKGKSLSRLVLDTLLGESRTAENC